MLVELGERIQTAFPAKVLNNFDGVLPAWWHQPINMLGKRISVVPDAFISSGSVVGWPRSVCSTVLTNTGESIVEAEFWRISRISQLPIDIVQQRGATKRLAGEYTYLGWLFGHYGHFLTESLSRFWYCFDDACPRKYLVHANYRSLSEFPKHVIAVLSAFGIGERNLIIVREPLIVDRLHCPAPALRCDDSFGAHMSDVYKHISKHSGFKLSEGKRKVYLSRASLPGDARQFNEGEIRTIFEKFGFETISPECLSFEDQLAVYSDCTHLAGPVGSGMHNAVFMAPRSEVFIVAPNNFLFRNDCLLSAACGYPLNYFIAKNGSDAVVSQKAWNVKVPELEVAIDLWLTKSAKVQ